MAGPLTLSDASMDLVVANPPYVTEKEKASMQSNVLNWEPLEALFVPDSDPLLFYRSIAPEAKRLLRSGGKLFLEINEKYGKEVSELLIVHGYKNVILRKDLSAKHRMIKAEK